MAYIGHLLWPSGLTIFYPHPGPGIAWWKVAVAGLVLVATTAAFALQRGKRPWLLCGWLWYLLTLAPVIGLVQVGDQAMADRYS